MKIREATEPTPRPNSMQGMARKHQLVKRTSQKAVSLGLCEKKMESKFREKI